MKSLGKELIEATEDILQYYKGEKKLRVSNRNSIESKYEKAIEALKEIDQKSCLVDCCASMLCPCLHARDILDELGEIDASP